MKITTNLYLNVISVVFIFLVSRIGCAQATEISPIIGVGQENFTFQVSNFDVANKDRNISFEPNIAGILRLGVNAYGFGIGYSFREALKYSDSRKGSTEFADLQLGYQTKNWGVDTFYQSYTGFFTSNTATIQSFPNLTFKHQGIAGRYALQESNFSVNAMMDQAEEVKSDSGKLYAVGGIHLYSMDVDAPLLQMENAGLDTELENLRKMKATSMNLGLGYGYNWLYSNRLFIGALLDLLGTYANYDYETTTASKSESDITVSYNLKISGGLANSHHRFGAGIDANVKTLKTTGRGYLKPTAGKILLYYRFVF